MPYNDAIKAAEYARQYRQKHRELINEKQRRREKEYRNGVVSVGQSRKPNLELRKQSCKKRFAKVREIIHSLKLAYGCVNPGCKWSGEFDGSQLDFHHVNRAEKKLGIAVAKSLSPNIAAEVNKCCVLCSNCHRLETHGKLNCSNFQRVEVELVPVVSQGREACYQWSIIDPNTREQRIIEPLA